MSRFPLPSLASPASVFVVTFLTLSLLAAAFPDGAAAAGEPVGEPSEQASEQPPVRERTWHETLAPAQAEAAKTGKLIFVDLFADWCGWCHVLDKNVFAAPVFDSLAERLVLVRIDVENGDEGT